MKLVFLFSIIGLASSVLVGDSPCTYSPSAICNNETLINLCGMKELCNNNLDCDLCNLAVKSLDNEIESEAFTNYLESYLYSTCDLFSNTTECMEAINLMVNYGSQWLVDNLGNVCDKYC